MLLSGVLPGSGANTFVYKGIMSFRVRHVATSNALPFYYNHLAPTDVGSRPFVPKSSTR